MWNRIMSGYCKEKLNRTIQRDVIWRPRDPFGAETAEERKKIPRDVIFPCAQAAWKSTRGEEKVSSSQLLCKCARVQAQQAWPHDRRWRGKKGKHPVQVCGRMFEYLVVKFWQRVAQLLHFCRWVVERLHWKFQFWPRCAYVSGMAHDTRHSTGTKFRSGQALETGFSVEK